MSSVAVTEQVQEVNVTENVTEISLVQTAQGIEIEEVIHELTVNPLVQQVTVTESPLEVTVASGVPGPQGPAGPQATYGITVAAGEALGGHRAVVVQGGEAFYADSSTLAHSAQVVGITTHATSATADIEVQFAGELEEPSWSWTPGAIYVGPNGTLTQTRPSSGWIMNIGVALTATKVLIHKTVSIEVA